MKKTNPFYALGLDPSALSGLTDAQIDVLVKGVAHTMQKICHPDVTASKKMHKKSRAINEAIALLDRKKYPEGFQSWKQDFCKKTPMKKKLDDAFAQVQKAQDHESHAYVQMMHLLDEFCFRQSMEQMEKRATFIIHNTWMVVQGVTWLPPENKATFYPYDIDEGGHVINSPDITYKKCIVGFIEPYIWLNHVVRDVKEVYDDLDKQRKIATTNAIRNKKSKFRGPIFTKSHLNILLPHVVFTDDVEVDGYIVSINRRDDEVFFQVDGSLRKIKTYNK